MSSFKQEHSLIKQRHWSGGTAGETALGPREGVASLAHGEGGGNQELG